MKIAFLYAGQGSQYVGMGQDFYGEFSTYQETIDNASEIIRDITECDLAAICFENSDGLLNQTRYTQPAMLSFAIGITKLLNDKGIVPEYSCGLSAGEYAALYSAGILSEDDALRIIAYRGKVMAEAAAGRSVRMAVVIGLPDEAVEKCCSEASDDSGIVAIANYNCPGQVSISGDLEAVKRASKLLKENGAKRVLPLNVSIASHTSLMKEAGDKLAEKLRNMDLSDEGAISKVVYNYLGREKNNTEDIAVLLEKQVQCPVRMADTIKYLAGQGVDTFIEIGPGDVVTKFVKRMFPDVYAVHIDTVEDYLSVVDYAGV